MSAADVSSPPECEEVSEQSGAMFRDTNSQHVSSTTLQDLASRKSLQLDQE